MHHQEIVQGEVGSRHHYAHYADQRQLLRTLKGNKGRFIWHDGDRALVRQ